MKILITSFALLLMFNVGCNEQTGISSPEQSSTNQLKLISLPVPSGGLGVESEYTVSKNIDGAVGGSFWASYSYKGGPKGTVYMTSGLNFPANSYNGVKNISQTFSSTGAAMVFGPSMQFNAKVDYTLKIGGLDLTGVNPETVKFVYIDSNGNIYPCEYSSIAVDITNGVLAVYNAKIPHFSRYGFVN